MKTERDDNAIKRQLKCFNTTLNGIKLIRQFVQQRIRRMVDSQLPLSPVLS